MFLRVLQGYQGRRDGGVGGEFGGVGVGWQAGCRGAGTGERIAIARNSGYIGIAMLISVADAKNQLSQLIRAVEDGEEVIITRSGKPVAQLTPAPTGARKVRLGTMRNRIVLKPGWDAPITEEQFFKGDF